MSQYSLFHKGFPEFQSRICIRVAGYISMESLLPAKSAPQISPTTARYLQLLPIKSVAVQAVYIQDVNKMWGRVEHLPQNRTSNILDDEKNRKIFVFFKVHFHNDECPCEKIILRCFFKHAVIYLCADTLNKFFANPHHLFHKYLMGIFFPESFQSF